MKLGALYRQVRDQFRAAQFETADLDARLLVSGILELAPLDLVLREEDLVQPDQITLVTDAAHLRLGGMPVGRVLGSREFYGLEFQLNADTLEPRPDTEILVDAVLALADANRPWRFLDLGTGTGAIAIALAANSPKAHGVAADISIRALEAAQENAIANGVGAQLDFVQADYAAPFVGPFDWVVSNPPYIASETVKGLDRSVREHDPLRALDGGPDGLDAYRVLIPQAKALLAPGGRIGLEIGFDQGESVGHLLGDNGFFAIEILADLGGRDRIVVAAIG